MVCEKINGSVKFMFMVDMGAHLWYYITIKGKEGKKMTRNEAIKKFGI